MSTFIAITGKGGTGKTTIASLLVRQLIGRGCGPVLAVDEDPNTCLDAALGVSAAPTLGRAREETRELASKGLAAGMAKQELLELKIAGCLVEADNFDLIAMGRPEGPGCYCYANNILKEVPSVVLDNEAGLENLSRRIVQKVDLMIFVADPSSQGVKTVLRLYELAREMGVQYRNLAVIVNRIPSGVDGTPFDALKAATRADWVVGLPEDDEIAALGRAGKGLWPLSAKNPVGERLDGLLSAAGISGRIMEVPQ